ncbi:MAG: tyrosine-type recombinase/integrase [Nitrososphaeraceae archaeon]
MGNNRKVKILLKSPVLNEFLDSIKNQPSSMDEHRNRLISLERFVQEKYKICIDDNFVLRRLEGESKNVKGKKIDVYKFLTEYCDYLSKNKPNISRKRFELLLHSARQAINYTAGNLIDNNTYRLRVKNLPIKSKNMKTRLDHKHIVEMILAINDLRLRTMVMLLSGSGLRMMEALKIKYKYLQWDSKPPVINLPPEVSKTREERNVILTTEMVKMLKKWLDYKYRNRKIVRVDGTKINVNDYKKPQNIDESYIFKVREDHEMENYRFIYKEFQNPFKDIVGKLKLGKVYPNGRSSVTLHSLRWFTQTTVERITGRDVVGYYWIGKNQKDYQFEPSEEELNELYSKVEPHLTFIDSKIIDQNQQKQIDNLTEQLNQQKKEVLLMRFEKIIENLIQEERDKKHSYGVRLSPERQYEYFVEHRTKNVKPEDLELLKEMLDKGEIEEYQEASEEDEGRSMYGE